MLVSEVVAASIFFRREKNMGHGVRYNAVLCTDVMTELKLVKKNSGPGDHTSLSTSPVCSKGLGKGRMIRTRTRDGSSL